MSITLKTHKMLWGRSANRCAYPGCRKELVMDRTATDDESVIGDEAHIIAREVDGPRGKSDLSLEQRDKYDNLILLCKVHHKLVDDQPNEYTVDKLQNFKRQHEKWVVQSLTSYDAQKQRDDELYSTYVEHWAKNAGLDHWGDLTVSILGSGAPRIWAARYKALNDLNTYLLSRVWPGRYRGLEAAFENFRRVLNDFQYIFNRHSFEEGKYLSTEKFYKTSGQWDPVLERLHDYHTALLSDLTLELTRAANYVCDRAREYLDPTFRLDKGAILLQSGPHGMDMSYHSARAEYRADERTDMPYASLEQFVDIRETRDGHYGKGRIQRYRLRNWPE